MRKLPSRDQPRPQDNSKQCLARLSRGQHHALVDLVEALEREGDPKGEVLGAMLSRTMQEMAQVSPLEPRFESAVVSLWQSLCVWAIRVMHDPKVEETVMAWQKVLRSQSCAPPAGR